MKVLRIFNIKVNNLIIKNIPIIVFVLFFVSQIDAIAQTEITKGTASYYAHKFQGKKTASGEKYDKNKYTAAHRTFPFGTKLKVTNLSNNKSVLVIVNDRGPYSKERLIDLSYAAAKEIEMIVQGIAHVSIEVLPKTSPSSPTKKQPQLANGYYNKELSPIDRPQGYLLQVGSYAIHGNAVARIDALKSHYIGNPCIEIAIVRRKKVYRVLYSGFSTREIASQKKIELNKKGISSIIIDAK